MGNISLILFLCFTVPLSMAVFVCGEKSKRVLLFFFFGTVMCLLCGDLGRFVVGIFSLDVNSYSKFIAPVIEELFKATPVLIYYYFFRPKKRALLECSLLLGIGFGMLENAYVLALNAENAVLADVIGRAFGSGMMHGVCTFAVGYGLMYFSSERKMHKLLPAVFMVLAVIYHCVYNILVLCEYKALGFAMPVLAFVPLVLIVRKKKEAEKPFTQG